jgi:hypothetical protein
MGFILSTLGEQTVEELEIWIVQLLKIIIFIFKMSLFFFQQIGDPKDIKEK